MGSASVRRGPEAGQRSTAAAAGGPGAARLGRILRRDVTCRSVAPDRGRGLDGGGARLDLGAPVRPRTPSCRPADEPWRPGHARGRLPRGGRARDAHHRTAPAGWRLRDRPRLRVGQPALLRRDRGLPAAGHGRPRRIRRSGAAAAAPLGRHRHRSEPRDHGAALRAREGRGADELDPPGRHHLARARGRRRLPQERPRRRQGVSRPARGAVRVRPGLAGRGRAAHGRRVGAASWFALRPEPRHESLVLGLAADLRARQRRADPVPRRASPAHVLGRLHAWWPDSWERGSPPPSCGREAGREWV